MTTELMKSFEKLENRYRLTGTLQLSHATHVGTGEEDDKGAALFATSNGIRIIPGSSFRGAFRSTVERLIYSLGGESCLLGANSLTHCPTSNAGERKEFQEKIKKREAEEKLYQDLAKKLCITCQVFGSPFMASRVRIADLHPKNNPGPEVRTRVGVGIDRDTETAATGVLYTYQVVEKGEPFHLELWAENMRPPDLGVLGLGLMELLAGNFWVGARSAAGLGQCRLLETSLILEYFDDAAGLKHYVQKGQFPIANTKQGAKVKEFFLEKINNLLEILPQK